MLVAASKSFAHIVPQLVVHILDKLQFGNIKVNKEYNCNKLNLLRNIVFHYMLTNNHTAERLCGCKPFILFIISTLLGFIAYLQNSRDNCTVI